MGTGRPFIRFAAAFVLMVTLGAVVFRLLPSAALGAPPGPRPGATPLVKPTSAPLVQPTATLMATATPKPRPTVGKLRTTVQPPPPVVAGPPRIAFAAMELNASSELWVVNPDGSGLVQLTNNNGYDGAPAWSPDGSQLAYQCCTDRTCDSGMDLCVMNADGSNPRVIARTVIGPPGRQCPPAWSPDGRRIAYTGGNPPYAIILASPDGSNPQQLAEGRNPTWSPDGSRVVFSDLVGGDVNHSELMIVGADGSGLRQVTQNGAGTSDFPAWSPDGAQLGYCLSGKGMLVDGLHMINPDGSGDRRVSAACMWGLSWSPDGSRLVTSDLSGAIVTQNADGRNVATLVQKRNAMDPSWSKSGGAVAVLPAGRSPAMAPVPPAPGQPAQPAQQGGALASLAGHLAYVVYKPGMSKPTYDVYISRVDGSDRRLLWEWGRQPRIRRGDGRVVLNGDGQGKDNLWTVNEDGSAARESSLHPEDAHPSWSPNGQRLLFDSEFYTWAGNRAWTIWVQNSVDKGSEPVSVSVAGRVVPGRAPLWLDNDWIVYTGCNFWEGGGSCGLYTAPSWGGDRARQLTTGADDVAGDVLGERIAYSSRLDGNWEIYTVNFDGGGKRNWTNNPANDGLPAFSPDGRSIAFVSDRGGAWAIWAMNADGSGQRKLFDLPGRMGDDWIMERISWGP